jgi:hypothetical protein
LARWCGCPFGDNMGGMRLTAMLAAILACRCGGEVQGSGVIDASVAQDAAVEGSATAAEATTEGGSCTILVTNYDRSCEVDTDCVDVSVGDYCAPRCLCGGGAIRASALAQFERDVSMTPAGSGAFDGGLDCPCIREVGPCCRRGVCQRGPGCLVDAGTSACPPGFACE